MEPSAAFKQAPSFDTVIAVQGKIRQFRTPRSTEMARRHTAALALAALAIALGGCARAQADAHPGWHTPTVTQSGTGGGQGQNPISPPSSTPTGNGTTWSPSPTSSPSTTPSSPPPPSAPPDPNHGHGPSGTWTQTGSTAVALTFDDGPDGNTAQVLDLLDKYQIKATFCIIGKQVASSAALIKRIVADGHTLCNHTWDHDEQLRTRSAAQIRADMQRTSDALHAVVPDAPIKYFRNPGGNFSAQVVSIAQSLGMTSLFWAVDPRDWSRPGTQSIINNVDSHTHPGSIVLMHDGGGDRSQTVAALKTILPYLKSRFALVPLPD